MSESTERDGPRDHPVPGATRERLPGWVIVVALAVFVGIVALVIIWSPRS